MPDIRREALRVYDGDHRLTETSVLPDEVHGDDTSQDETQSERIGGAGAEELGITVGRDGASQVSVRGGTGCSVGSFF